MIAFDRSKSRLLRKRRIRKKISGTEQRPRLTIFKSLKHIYAQLIDDTTGRTLASISTLDSDFKTKLAPSKNMAASELIGELIGKVALTSGIKSLVFDRNGYLYHGKTAKIVDKVRESGVSI